MKTIPLLVVFLLGAAALLEFSATAQTDSGIRFLQLRNDGGTIKIGDLPMFLSTYDADGRQAGSLSGDLKNAIVDAQGLPRNLDPFSPTLGVQVEGAANSVTVSMRVRKAGEVFVDENRLVFPETAALGERISTHRAVVRDGPFINLTFLNSSQKVISLSSLDIKVWDQAGKQLDTVNQDFEIVLVKSVQPAPLRVAMSDRRSGRSWTTNVFPIYRSGVPDLILYAVRNVPIGSALGVDPSYEDRVAEISDKVKANQTKCAAGDFAACNDLAVSLSKGDGIAQDSVAAARWFDKACNGGIAVACRNLGAAYISGDGVNQDYGKARELFGKACDLNEAASCYNIGAMNLNGYGGAQNAAEGSRLMKKACSLGLQQACSIQ
jgi:hypothetical protein